METFESPRPLIAEELGSRVCGTKAQTVRGGRGAMNRRVYESREACCFIGLREPGTQAALGEKSPEKTMENLKRSTNREIFTPDVLVYVHQPLYQKDKDSRG